MAALSLLPIWVFMYVALASPSRRRSPPARSASAPRSTARCAVCHGAGGEGGVGRPFADGEVLETFPHIEDQLRFVYFGTAQLQHRRRRDLRQPRPRGRPARRPDRSASMPAQGVDAGGDLTDDEILAVVCHERYTLGGADPTSDEYAEEFENWCSDEAPMYVALEAA